MVQSFCKLHDIPNNMWQFENEHLDWLPIFEDLITSNIDVIVMTSIYSLPDDVIRREKLMDLAIDNEKDSINKYLNFGHKQKGWYPWET